MSAQIPETMLMSDLLKSTGYECPEDLQGRTFAEATAGGDVQTNKASTIDVSAYTEPIVIKPDTDYESMKKNTLTLTNIPSAGATLYAWEADESGLYANLNIATAPADSLSGVKGLVIGEHGDCEVEDFSIWEPGEYTKVSDTKFTVGTKTYERVAAKDCAIWG